MLDVNVESHLMRTVMDGYRRTLLTKENRNKQKTLWKVIQGRSWRRADGEDKLEQMAMEIDRSGFFWASATINPVRGVVLLPGNWFGPDPWDGVWKARLLPGEIGP